MVRSGLRHVPVVVRSALLAKIAERACHNGIWYRPESALIGNRKAFKQAAIGYLCIGIFLGVGLAFYGTTWVRWVDIGWLIGGGAIMVVGSLAATALGWRRAKVGDPIGPIYLHHLLRHLLLKKDKRWMLGKDKTDASH